MCSLHAVATALPSPAMSSQPNTFDPPRTASVQRRTGETSVAATVNLDGTGQSSIQTGVGFFDHMLDLLCRHAMLDLTIKAEGDLHVDDHHTVEDVGLTLGKAIAKAIGDKRGIRRYGQCVLPMDETLAICGLDFSGRAYCRIDAVYGSPTIGTFAVELVEEFWKSVAAEARLTLHVDVPRAGNSHHVAEAIFKSVARSIRMAVESDPRQQGVPSTKGTLVD